MVRVDSGQVVAIGFEPQNGILRAERVDGRHVEFAFVPPELFVEVLNAPSVGAALNNSVKARGYTCHPVEGGKA